MAEQDTAAPVAAPVVFDPPHIYLHKDSRVPPLPVYTQTQADALPPEWMSPDVWNAGGGGGGGGGSQTPWTGDVDAAGFNLRNVSMVDCGQVYNGGELRLQSSSAVVIGGPGPISLAGSSIDIASGEVVFSLSGDQAYNNITAPLNLSIDAPVIYIGTPTALTVYGGKVSIGTTAAPAYTLDVAGDVNCSGQFLVNGTPVALISQAELTQLRSRLQALEARMIP